MQLTFIQLARLFIFVRELSGNHGQRVNGIQIWGGGKDGDSWCAYFVTFILDIFFQGNSPIPRMGSANDIYLLCIKKNYIVTTPQPNDLFFYSDIIGHVHHVGFVTEDVPLIGIAGNTSADGTSVNGDRVAEHEIHTKLFARIPH